MFTKKYLILCICLINYSALYSHKPLLSPQENSLTQLYKHNVIQNKQPIRLHLGCGETHLTSYINLDFPLSEHTIQTKSGADVFADITTLNFPNQSIREIRSHHFFEHFDRQTAIALLCKWHEWLEVGGTLYIETPDFEDCVQALINASFVQKQRIIRHIFGSHEAYWAIHYDGWFQEKYNHFLTKLGFSDITFRKTKWLDTYNIHVTAKKHLHLSRHELKSISSNLLQDYCIDHSPCEKKIHATWMNAYQDATKKMSCKD